MDQIFDYGFGIAIILGFTGFIWLKSRKWAAAHQDRHDDAYWDDRQSDVDTPDMVACGSDDSDSGSDD